MRWPRYFQKSSEPLNHFRRSVLNNLSKKFHETQSGFKPDEEIYVRPDTGYPAGAGPDTGHIGQSGSWYLS